MCKTALLKKYQLFKSILKSPKISTLKEKMFTAFFLSFCFFEKKYFSKNFYCTTLLMMLHVCKALYMLMLVKT